MANCAASRDRVVATIGKGCIIAAAGCGKTEQLVRSTALSAGRRLILTHTHAGVNAIRQRMKKNDIASSKFYVDTIAGWSLRFATAFPATSGVDIVLPPSNDEWTRIYAGATKLVASGAITRVLKASYSGLFVDEYQDCTELQHGLICALANHLPTCLFGDPMQAIFGFSDRLADWDTDILPKFPRIDELVTPWRWRNGGNLALGKWLKNVRLILENEQPLQLSPLPAGVEWRYLSGDASDRSRWQTITEVCRSFSRRNESVIVIADSANQKARAKTAQRVSTYGYGNIEPVNYAGAVESAMRIDNSHGEERLVAVLDFVAECMTGVGKSKISPAVKSQLRGGKRGQKEFGEIIPQCIEVLRNQSWKSILILLASMNALSTTRLYRPELYGVMCSALQRMLTGDYASLSDAVKATQQAARHAGRIIRLRNVGSTLLVKGLEYDHVVIIDADKLDRNNLYVALTRAKLSVTILSETRRLMPKLS